MKRNVCGTWETSYICGRKFQKTLCCGTFVNQLVGKCLSFEVFFEVSKTFWILGFSIDIFYQKFACFETLRSWHLNLKLWVNWRKFVFNFSQFPCSDIVIQNCTVHYNFTSYFLNILEFSFMPQFTSFTENKSGSKSIFFMDITYYFMTFRLHLNRIWRLKHIISWSNFHFLESHHNNFYFSHPQILGCDTASELLQETSLKEIGNADDSHCMGSRPSHHMSTNFRMVGHWHFCDGFPSLK